MDERSLIHSIQAYDNRNAFAFLVRQHQSSLRLYLRRLTAGDNELADDLAQETFLKAYKNIRGFQLEARFSTWLFTIARNTFLDQVKTRRLTSLTTEEQDSLASAPESAPESARESVIDLISLINALDHLGDEERTLLKMCYLEGRSQREAARFLQIPLGTLKSRLLNVKNKLLCFLAEAQ